MNPIGTPVTASVYLANSRENVLQGDTEMASERSRMRSAITRYPSTLTDVRIKNIARARQVIANASVNLRGSGITADESA